MLSAKNTSSRAAMDLSGIWDFQADVQKRGAAESWWCGLPEPVPMAVPGSWNSQGVETGEKEFFGLGWYQIRTPVPFSLAGKRLFVYVGAVCFKARLWVDSHEVGSTDIPFLPFVEEVTDLVEAGGEATITICVDNELGPEDLPGGYIATGEIPAVNEGKNPWVPFDWYPFGGIHRSVKLLALPNEYIEDVTVQTMALLKGARLAVEVVCVTAEADVQCRLELTDGKNSVAEATLAGPKGSIELEVSEPRLWCPNDPFLYSLRIELLDQTGKPVDRYSLPVGIRTIRVEGNRLLLNGEPIRIRGFGKHEDFPVLGKASHDAIVVKDFNLMQWTGANCFRTCHYPYAEEWQEMADRQGMLVIDECPAERLFCYDGAEVEVLLAKHKRQVEALIKRDKNHPSVIMWSLGNEPASEHESTGEYFEKMISFAKSLDSSRPVTVPTNRGKWYATGGTGVEYVNRLTDVVCINRYYGWYTHYGMIDEALAGLSEALDDVESLGKPVILSEFGAECIPGYHDTADRQFSEEFQARLLRESIKVAESKPSVVGTIIWCFADARSPQDVTRVFYNNKGVFTRIREPKLAAWQVRKVWTGKDL